jgi:hypothetical protein
MSIGLPLLPLQGLEAQNAHAGDPDDAGRVRAVDANVSDLCSLLILGNYAEQVCKGALAALCRTEPN